jgi:ribosomal protein S27AE
MATPPNNPPPEKPKFTPAPVPSPEVKLEQRTAFFEWLREKWPTATQACPICGVIQWTITDVQQLTEFTPGMVRIGGGPVIPIIGVMCGNCGYMRWFNALLSGAVKPQHPSQPPGAPSSEERPE